MATLILPCAGSGARLDPTGPPKPLTRFGRTTLIEYILGKISSLFHRIVLVVNPAHEELFRHTLDQPAHADVARRLHFAFQSAPRGSLDAVLKGLERMTETDTAVVVWGDQVGVSQETVRLVLKELDGADVVVPVIEMRSPYVWLEMEGDQLVRVGRLRDGDTSPDIGLADLGVFGLSQKAQAYLLRPSVAQRDPGKEREMDFTYALPSLARALDLRQICRLDENEALAVNSPHELLRASEKLKI